MANGGKNTQTVVFRGKTSFAKILGAPRLNYSGDAKEWAMDLEISKEVVREAKALGIGDRVKTKDEYLNGAPYMTFKQRELRKDGSPNDPIRVVDIKGNPWPQETLLGNGTDVDVKFVVMDHGSGKKKGVYIRSVRVLKLSPYKNKEFDDIDEGDEFFNEAQAAEALAAERAEAEDKHFKKTFMNEEDDLNDDVPPFDEDPV